MITILSNYSDNISKLNDLTAPNKLQYAEANGYEFVNLKIDYSPKMHVFMLEDLLSRLEERDTVMTMGCDAIFTNFNVKIPESPAPISLCKEELRFWPINNDVMIWQSCTETIQVLRKIIDARDEWLKMPWLWQNWLWNALQTDLKIKSAVEILEARKMNSTHQNCPSRWQLGDWIIHFLDFSLDDKIKLANHYLKFVGNGSFYPSMLS